MRNAMKTLTFRFSTAGWFALLLLLSYGQFVPLSSAKASEPAPDLRNLLTDPSPKVRKDAALKLAKANDAQAIPILIDLLAELPANDRQPIEKFLTALAGEWAPVTRLGSEDRIARKILAMPGGSGGATPEGRLCWALCATIR